MGEWTLIGRVIFSLVGVVILPVAAVSVGAGFAAAKLIHSGDSR